MEMLNLNMFLGSDLWTTLINLFAKWLTNYGWTIIVFTIALKIVLLPIDILQRVATQKNSKVMSAMQPEIDEINKKYANDKAKANQETQKLYQKYKVNLGGMCLTMLLSIGISLAVFLTLFGSIRTYGTEKLTATYHQVDTAYVQAYNEYDSSSTELSREDFALDAALTKYENLKSSNSWFWVKNVWKGDKNVSQFVDFGTYEKTLSEEERADAKVRYEIITAKIQKQEGNKNGYFVLIIVAGLVSLGAQFLTSKILAPKGQKLNKMNIIMMVAIPLSMVLFTYNSNVVFTLYTITNSLMTALTSVIMTFIFNRNRKDEKPEDVLLKRRDVEVVEYSRNYKKR